MRLAIFDVDGTLISGKSTERRFIFWLLRHGHIGPRQILSSLWYVLRRFPIYGRHVFRKNKAYLHGLQETVVADEAMRFVSTLADSDWIKGSVAEVRRHLVVGDVVVLMSGTLQPIIDALAANVGAHSAVGTICDIRHGSYTGVPPLRHPFYNAKALLLDEVCARHGVSVRDAIAYADSRFDIPLLERVGTAVAVGPDRYLEAWAGRNDCRIIEY